MYNNNGHQEGFNNTLLLSNKTSNETIDNNKSYICFYSYDYKNQLEWCSHKKNNPLQFPQQLIIEVECELDANQLCFSNTPEKPNKINLQQTVSKAEYIKKVNALKQHIQQGDIYEINYCITFEAFDVIINPFNVYQKLNSISKAPYSALAKFNNQWIISSSPELFLSKRSNSLITKPIKGTAKRSNINIVDAQLKKDLYENIKERNENVMIVDVCRNDLSRIASKGSVKVPKLYDIESYQQVHQMVSTISCDLKPNVQWKEIIDSTFPMASMTGAPKIRAMQLIDEFEVYNRNAYSGSLGYINAHKEFDLNVLIRSIFYDSEKKHASFTVGSAITALCDAEEEYEECLLKAKAMLEVLNH